MCFAAQFLHTKNPTVSSVFCNHLQLEQLGILWVFITQSTYVFSCSVFFPFTCTKPSQGAATLKPGLRRPVKASGRGAAAGRSLFDESQRRRPVLILLRLETSHLISVGIDKRPRAPKRRERQSGGEVTQTSPNDPGLARGQGGGRGQGPEGGHETLRDSGASQARERRSVRQGAREA